MSNQDSINLQDEISKSQQQLGNTQKQVDEIYQWMYQQRYLPKDVEGELTTKVGELMNENQRLKSELNQTIDFEKYRAEYNKFQTDLKKVPEGRCGIYTPFYCLIELWFPTCDHENGEDGRRNLALILENRYNALKQLLELENQMSNTLREFYSASIPQKYLYYWFKY